MSYADDDEPVAYGVYGRASGNLKYVQVMDESEVEEQSEFYDVVPLFPRPVLRSADTDLIAWHVEQVESLRPFRRSSAQLKAAMMHAATVRALRAAEPRPAGHEQDELEVQDLATIIGNVVIDSEDTGPHSQRPITVRDTCADWPMEIAGEVHAHGFRRYEPQGEPSDIALDDAIAAFNGYPGDAIDHSSRAWQRERMAATLRAARSAR